MAVIDGDWVLTLAEFNAMVNRYGNVLREAGVRAGEKVLWVGQNSAEVVAINHAARKVGAVCVPMNYRLAPDETQYVIDNCDAVVVLFDIEQVPQLESIRDQCDRVREWFAFRLAGAGVPEWARDLDAEAAAASADEPDREGDDPAAGTTMIYTSGTTGKPKGTVRRTTTNAADTAAFIQLVGWVPTTSTCRPARSTTRPRSASCSRCRPSAGRWSCSATSTRRAGCAWCRSTR